MVAIHGGGPQGSTTKSTGDAVVEAIAEREGIDPVELDDCLYDVVDPDALEKLVTGTGRIHRIEFTYLGYRVVVDGDGNVDVGTPAE